MSIPHSPRAHQTSNRPNPHHPPTTRPLWEEGESEQGSEDDDAEGEEDEGGQADVRLSVEEEAAGPSEDDLPSPYNTTHHRAPPRITLRLNHPANSDRKDGQHPNSGSPEAMDLDISSDSVNLPTDRNTSARPDESSHTHGPTSFRRTATPPGSPLRAFIALPAPVAAPAAPAPPRNPSPTRPQNHGATARPAAYPTPASRSAVYTNGGPGPGSGQSTLDPNPPQPRPLGSLWKTSPAVNSKPPQMALRQEEDVEMGDQGRDDEEEDELDDDAPSESFDDDKEYEPAPVRKTSSATAGSSRKGANGSGPVVSGAGSANGNGKPKRATRGPGKKQKTKAKEREREKENVQAGEASREDRRGEEGTSESAGKDGKTDFAYEYVAVFQRKEGRQHM